MNNKQTEIKTDYIDAKIRVKNQLGFFEEKPDPINNASKLIHIHAPYGMGKSLLLEGIKKDIDKEIKITKNPIKRFEIFNTFIHNEEDFDNILSSNSENDIDKIRTKKMHIIFWKKLWIILLNLLIALSIGMIPVYSSNIGLYVKAIPGFMMSAIVVPFLIWSYLKYSIRIKNNRVIVIENLDRHEWNLIIHMLQNSHRASRKYNIKFIFSYSMNNLLERYYEKYGKVTNLYLLLDKYIEFEINLLKYSDSVKPIIVNKITEGLHFENGIDYSLISNYRLLERTVIKLKNNKSAIEVFKLDNELLFYLEYLAISDLVAYEWIKDNIWGIKQANNNFTKIKWFRSDISLAADMAREGNGEYKIEKAPIDVKESLGISILICDWIYRKADENKMQFYFIDDKVHEIASKYNEIIKGTSIDENALALNEDPGIPDYVSFNYLKLNLNDLSNKTKFSFLHHFNNFKNMEDQINFVLSIGFKDLNAVELIYLWGYIIRNVFTLFPLEYSYRYEAHNYSRFSFFLEEIEKFKQSKIIESSYSDGKAGQLFIKTKKYIIELSEYIINISKNTKFNYLYEKYIGEKYIPWETHELMIMSISVDFKKHYHKVVELLGELHEKENVLDWTLFLLLFDSEIDQLKDKKNIFVLAKFDSIMKKKVSIEKLMMNQNFASERRKLSDFKEKYKKLWK